MNKQPEEKQQTKTEKPNKAGLYIYMKNGKFKQNIDETGGKMDPYIKFKLGSQTVTSSVKNNAGKFPIWNENEAPLILQRNMDMDSHKLLIEVYDDVDTGRDNIIGKSEFEIDNIQIYRERENKIINVFRNGNEFGTIEFEMEDILDEKQEQKLGIKKEVMKMRNFLEDSGFNIGMKLILCEIMSKDIPRNNVFQYSIKRLKEFAEMSKESVDKLHHKELSQSQLQH